MEFAETVGDLFFCFITSFVSAPKSAKTNVETTRLPHQSLARRLLKLIAAPCRSEENLLRPQLVSSVRRSLGKANVVSRYVFIAGTSNRRMGHGGGGERGRSRATIIFDYVPAASCMSAPTVGMKHGFQPVSGAVSIEPVTLTSKRV